LREWQRRIKRILAAKDWIAAQSIKETSHIPQEDTIITAKRRKKERRWFRRESPEYQKGSGISL